MYQIELYHLGDQCAPGIIIDDILNIHNKTLFMLGVYKFNDIIKYLNDNSNNNYEIIYEDKLLIIDNNTVKHSLYNFHFNHDYKLLNDKITNYDIIKNRFDIKIKNFKEMLISDNLTVFITFSDNVDNLNIINWINWINKNKKLYHLIIFTSNNYKNTIDIKDLSNLSIIKLKQKYNGWWKMIITEKLLLYNEIYEKFISNWWCWFYWFKFYKLLFL